MLPFHTSEEQLVALINNVKDWQLNDGSLLKLVRTEDEHTILSRPVGATLYPTFFPRECFEHARNLQTIYNRLYAAIACDEGWLHQTLAPLLEEGSFASKLWSIHQKVKEEGYVQDLCLGLFRSDYMLHSAFAQSRDRPMLKQVEFNTYSCAGLVHSSRISGMHRHLCRAGYYKDVDIRMKLHQLPSNQTFLNLTKGLAAAYNEYGALRSSRAMKPGVLMVVQSPNINVCDERPIEYALWDMDIPAYRVTWGEDVLKYTSLTTSRELLFHPPNQNNSQPVEIALVYLRAGLDEAEYNSTGIQCRLLLERSRAIKCPSVMSHLSGFKVVQQALTGDEGPFRFLDSDNAMQVAGTFMPIFPLDSSESGLQGINLARNPVTAINYVLKPSLEGGGHNIYKDDIPDFLGSIQRDLWKNFTLMQLITPPQSENILISPEELYSGPIESELGILGACLWRQERGQTQLSPFQILLNVDAGFTLKTKAKGVNELSVVKGYGCFDSPCLFDTF